MGARRTRRLRSPSLIEEDEEEGARRRRAPSLVEEGARRTRRGPGGGRPQTPREPPASPRTRKMKRGYVWHLILCRLAQLSVGPCKKI